MFEFSRSIDEKKRTSTYHALNEVLEKKSGRYYRRTIIVLLLLILGSMFLPWTQNIRTKGSVIALKPEQRPQAVQSIIDGQILKWYVQEGDHVEKGDTLIHVTEVKEGYLDPDLITLTSEQLDAKKKSQAAYENKIEALRSQLKALEQQRELKIDQIRNKLTQTRLKLKNDSINNQLALKNKAIADNQFQRAKELEGEGLRSLTELEDRRLKYERESAMQEGVRNQLDVWKNELLNLDLELSATRADLNEKIAKVRSDIYSTESLLLDNDAEVAKMQNRVNTYKKRMEQYYLRAPQTGYVTQAVRSGVGEIILAGTDVMTIMPEKYDLAVEMYVAPVDLPLIQKGTKVRIQFDGWPAVVFSGWPNTSFGTYSGRVQAIDNFISPNGMYRVVVQPDETDGEWPSALRVGSGARSIALLGRVQVWYELWRQLNGFPPDFYVQNKDETVSAGGINDQSNQKK